MSKVPSILRHPARSSPSPPFSRRPRVRAMNAPTISISSLAVDPPNTHRRPADRHTRGPGVRVQAGSRRCSC